MSTKRRPEMRRTCTTTWTALISCACTAVGVKPCQRAQGLETGHDVRTGVGVQRAAAAFVPRVERGTGASSSGPNEEARRIREVIPGLPIPAAQFETIIATCRDLERHDRADALIQLTLKQDTRGAVRSEIRPHGATLAKLHPGKVR